MKQERRPSSTPPQAQPKNGKCNNCHVKYKVEYEPSPPTKGKNTPKYLRSLHPTPPYTALYTQSTQRGYKGTHLDHKNLVDYLYHQSINSSGNNMKIPHVSATSSMQITPTRIGNFSVTLTPPNENNPDCMSTRKGFRISEIVGDQRGSWMQNLRRRVDESKRLYGPSLWDKREIELDAVMQQRHHHHSHQSREKESKAHTGNVQMPDKAAASNKPIHINADLPLNNSQILPKIHALPHNHEIITKFSIRITAHDLLTLKHPHWLNDNVITFYLRLLMEKNPSIFSFSTHFYPKLRDQGYGACRKTTRRTPVLTNPAYEQIFFPIHLGMHWCLAAINLPQKTIKYYDSLQGSNPACLQVLFTWLSRDHEDKLGAPLATPTHWRLSSPKDRDIPVQENGYDCGVFTLMYALWLACKQPTFDFTQSAMRYWRDRIALDIIRGEITI